MDAKMVTETQANACSHKTASGVLIPDCGGLRVQGTTEFGYAVTFQSRKADVHKTLISATTVHSKGMLQLQTRMEATSSLTTAKE